MFHCPYGSVSYLTGILETKYCLRAVHYATLEFT